MLPKLPPKAIRKGTPKEAGFSDQLGPGGAQAGQWVQGLPVEFHGNATRLGQEWADFKELLLLRNLGQKENESVIAARSVNLPRSAQVPFQNHRCKLIGQPPIPEVAASACPGRQGVPAGPGHQQHHVLSFQIHRFWSRDDSHAFLTSEFQDMFPAIPLPCPATRGGWWANQNLAGKVWKIAERAASVLEDCGVGAGAEEGVWRT